MSEDLKHQFLSATDAQKQAILLSFAIQMTILMRGEYGKPNPDIRKYNEILHRITSQALAMMIHSNRYPDEVFIDMLIIGVKDKGLVKILEHAFRQGTERDTPTNSTRDANEK